MDINDITARMNRILSALKSRVDDDYERHAKVEFEGDAVIVTLPGKDDESTLEFKVMSILHLIATAKDHLKKAIQSQGKSAQIVEYVVNASLHLQVLIDIINADKHTYPTKTNRSKLNPQVKNVRQGLINNNNGKPIVMNISPKGDLKMLDGIPPSVAISADIVDGSGNYIFDLDTLVESCYERWHTTAVKYGCI